MKTKHTPEPWQIGKHQDQIKVDGTYIATCSHNSTYNAARIVACVNACAGMEDPAAEIAALRQRIAELEAQVPKRSQEQTKPELEDFYVDCTREQYPEVKRILEAQGYRLFSCERWSYNENCVAVEDGEYFLFWKRKQNPSRPTLTLAQLREKYGLKH